jgi:hypothetical protein
MLYELRDGIEADAASHAADDDHAVAALTHRYAVQVAFDKIAPLVAFEFGLGAGEQRISLVRHSAIFGERRSVRKYKGRDTLREPPQQIAGGGQWAAGSFLKSRWASRWVS